MGPKRRYQCSTVLGGLRPPPPKPLPPSSPPEYFSNLTYSYSQPITPAQIAVNPCLSSKKITSAAAASSQKTKPSTSGGGGTTSKGNRTYRVKHHHQNHYELPVVHPPPTPLGGGGDPRGGGDSRPSTATNMALSQGIFGLPVMQEYFAVSPEDYLENQRPPPSPPQPKPRMRTTLPSSMTSSKPADVTMTSGHNCEDMDGILQVRPASRSRTRPELNGGGGYLRRSQGGGAAGGRRRAQSSVPEGLIKLFPEEETGGGGGDSDLQQKPSGDIWDTILGKLRSQDADWEEILDGFQMINKWAGLKWPSGFLKKVIWAGLPHLGSQRTKLSRAACQCFKVLYERGAGGGGGGEGMGGVGGEGDRVFQRLLDLCGGTQNKFIREESKGALLAAVENLEGGKVLGLLEQYGWKHRNGGVKEYASYLLGRWVDRVGVERVMGGKGGGGSGGYAQKVLPMIVGFLMEAGLQTRINAKACLSKIYGHPEFQNKLRRYVPAQNIRNVQETLKKMQSSGGGGGGGAGASCSSSQLRRSSAKWN